MFDIGAGELLVLAIIAVLVIGPERLPRVIAQAAGWARTARGYATAARDDLARAADLEGGQVGELRDSFAQLSDLRPRSFVSGLLDPTSSSSSPGRAWSARPPEDAPAGDGSPEGLSASQP